HAGRVPQHLTGTLGVDLGAEHRVDRDRVAGHDRYPHTGRGHLQVGQAENLAGLVAHLQLFARPARVAERAGPGHDIQREWSRERAEVVADRLAHVARPGAEGTVAADLVDLPEQGIDADLAGTGNRLVGREYQLLEPVLAV